MSFLSSVFKAIVGVVSGIIKAVLSVVRKLLPLIIIIVACYFIAPYLAAGLLELGAPAWLSSAVASFPAFVDGAIGTATAFIGKYGSLAWESFMKADLSTKMMVIGSAGLAFAPEQTIKALSDTASAVGDAVGGVIGGVVTGATGINFPVVIGLGVAAWFLLRAKPAVADNAPAKQEGAK